MLLPSLDYVPEPEHPPSPDYVSGPKHPPSPVYVPYVPEPAYPEFMPLEDDVFPAEEQPLSAGVSPAANSPGYITESDPEEDPEEDDEDLDEDPTDYPADRDDEEEEEESFKDDANDEEEDEDKDEEHLAPADSVPLPTYHTTARMSIRAQTPIPFMCEAEVDRLLAIPTPPPSPLHHDAYLYPLIPSSTLPVSSHTMSPPPLPISPTHPLGFRAAMIRLRAELPSTSYPLPLPPPIVLLHTRASMVMMRAAEPSTYILAPRSKTPPLGTPPLLPYTHLPHHNPLLLPSTDCRADVPEVTLSPRKRLCIAPDPRYEIRESLTAPTARLTGGFRADYGFVGTLDAEIRQDLDREVGYGITDTWDEMDTDEIYRRRDDAQDDRSLMSGPVNFDTTRSEVSAPQTTVLAQQTEIGDLRAADRRRQTQLIEALTLLRTLQTQMAALQSQQRPAGDPAHLDVPKEVGSSS
ncbi:hypothetical protein Tco_1418625 [Tanacetum coccineum]